jgi:hypothetical protein
MPTTQETITSTTVSVTAPEGGLYSDVFTPFLAMGYIAFGFHNIPSAGLVSPSASTRQEAITQISGTTSQESISSGTG